MDTDRISEREICSEGNKLKRLDVLSGAMGQATNFAKIKLSSRMGVGNFCRADDYDRQKAA